MTTETVRLVPKWFMYYFVKSEGISTDGQMATLKSSDKDAQQASCRVKELIDSKGSQ